MSGLIRCSHCGRSVRANPRLREQRYCGDRRCQRARKTLWQRQKIATDADYQANQRDCQRRWRARNRDYWGRYRSRHPGYLERNRLLQRARNRKRRLLQRIAKMDAFRPLSPKKAKTYYLIPQIAKMDALGQKVLLIPAA
jgi:hypothetical protein